MTKGILYKLPFVLFLFFSFPLMAFSQTVITGNIRDKKGEPLIATVMLQESHKPTVLGYATSNAAGNYTLKYEGKADSIKVVVTGMTIGKHSRTVPNRSARVDFAIVENKPVQLKEVTVNAQKIRKEGDTLNYLVSAYTNQNDRVIGDVLKKMPGIEVSSSGGVSYNGKAINKFYVENMDLLQGRYGIATNNIAAKDVATVQVLENHQPLKVLKGVVISDNAAINLKLKEKAKGTLAITGMAGLGYKPVLWNAELVGMYFKKKGQNITVYKGNNTGDEMKSEFRAHYDYERAMRSMPSVLGIQMAGVPPVSRKRYLDNTTHSLTANQLLKLKKGDEITVSALYCNDKIKKEGYSRYDQYLSIDSTLTIAESIHSLSKINNLEIAIRYNQNKDNYFLNNAFNMKANWNDSRASGLTQSNSGVDEVISQNLDRPEFLVDNTLDLVKKIKNRYYKLYFSTAYGQASESLTVHPADYLGLNGYKSFDQQASSENIAAVLRLSYGIRKGYVTLDYGLWSRIDLQKTNTELTGFNAAGTEITAVDSLKNHLWYNTYQAGITQNYTYQKGKIKANAAIPISYWGLNVKDSYAENLSPQSKLTVTPKVFALYDISQMFALSASAAFDKSYGDKNLCYSGYILKNYRSLERSTNDNLLKNRSSSASFSVNYRNPFKALFINGGIGYSYSSSNLLYGYDYSGIMRIMTSRVRPTDSKGYSFKFNSSKGFDFWTSTIRLGMQYRTGNNTQLIQGEAIKYKSENYLLTPGFNISPISLISLNYSLSWSKSRNYIKNQPAGFSAIENIFQNGQLSIFPSKKLTINLNAEHRYNSAAGRKKTSFADAAVKWKNKQVDWEITMNNIFNSKQYVSASYSSISSYYYAYELRPFSILVKNRFKIK